jgi:hypothetical protein
MNQGSGPSTRTILLWVGLAVAGLCAVCGAATVALVALGVVAGNTDPATTSADPPMGRPGVAGGFSMSLPASFTQVAEGRWRHEQLDGQRRHTVEVIKLAAVPGLEQPHEALKRLWNEVIRRDWPDAPPTPLPMRRFVNNGARAHFTSAALQPRGNANKSLVSVYLIEAGDRLEPLVVLQEYFDDSVGAMMVARGSWDETHPAVEALFKQVEGSPIGLPLISGDEAQGAWVTASGASQQYVNVLTGSTTFSAISTSLRFQLAADHTFSYQYASANTRLGSTTFGGQRDQGRWKIEHDLLVLEGDARTVKYLIIGAGLVEADHRVLYLLPEPHWSFSPGAISQHGELFDADLTAP